MSKLLESLLLEKHTRCESCGNVIGYGEPYSHYYYGVRCGAHEMPMFRNGDLSDEVTALCRLQRRQDELVGQLDWLYHSSEDLETAFKVFEELIERDIVPDEVKLVYKLLEPFMGKLREFVEIEEWRRSHG